MLRHEVKESGNRRGEVRHELEKWGNGVGLEKRHTVKEWGKKWGVMVRHEIEEWGRGLVKEWGRVIRKTNKMKEWVRD